MCMLLCVTGLYNFAFTICHRVQSVQILFCIVFSTVFIGGFVFWFGCCLLSFFFLKIILKLFLIIFYFNNFIFFFFLSFFFSPFSSEPCG